MGEGGFALSELVINIRLVINNNKDIISSRASTIGRIIEKVVE